MFVVSGVSVNLFLIGYPEYHHSHSVLPKGYGEQNNGKWLMQIEQFCLGAYGLSYIQKMDNLPHARVVAHLSRYSLASSSVSMLNNTDGHRRFYCIITLSLKNLNLIRLALAFDCARIIVVRDEQRRAVKGVVADEEEKEEDDDSVICKQFEAELADVSKRITYVSSLNEASALVKDHFGCDEIIGIYPRNGFGRESANDNASNRLLTDLSVADNKAFSISPAFIFEFVDVNAEAICDRFLYISTFASPTVESGISSLKTQRPRHLLQGLQIEACASITFHRFLEPSNIGTVTPTVQSPSRTLSHLVKTITPMSSPRKPNKTGNE